MKPQRLALLILAGAMSLCSRGIAEVCPLNFGEPRSWIEGCNEQGYVLISEKLAELTIPGEKAPVPIWATFDSSRMTPSPFAGMGWRIPFLEVSLVQLNENEFMLLEPGGWRRLFRRAGKNSNILNGSGDWKGQLSRDKATLWADCGWRLDFTRGKITSIKTSNNKTLEYNYVNGRLSSITCGGQLLVSVDSAEMGGKLNITIGDKRYTLEKSDRPRVQSIEDINVVAGTDPSFHQWIGGETPSRTFEYSVDKKLNPVMTITGPGNLETTVGWNPETRRIAYFGDWKYDIKPSASPVENAAISRVNAAGAKEYWFRDPSQGVETLELDGVRKITSRFVRGPLTGAVRRKEEIKDGQTTVTYQAAYNEEGRLLRETMADGQVHEYTYSEKGETLTRTTSINGVVDSTTTFEKGRSKLKRWADGSTKEYFYDKQGRENKILLDGKLHSEKTFAPDDSWEKNVIYDKITGEPARTFFREFDVYGRIVLDKSTEHLRDSPELVDRYFYNALGQLERRENSRDGTYTYTTLSSGKRIEKHIKELTNLNKDETK